MKEENILTFTCCVNRVVRCEQVVGHHTTHLVSSIDDRREIIDQYSLCQVVTHFLRNTNKCGMIH